MSGFNGDTLIQIPPPPAGPGPLPGHGMPPSRADGDGAGQPSGGSACRSVSAAGRARNDDRPASGALQFVCTLH